MKYDFTEVRTRLAKKGWTLQQWSDRTGVHYTTLAKALERGSASQVTAKLMARSLGIDFETMVGVEEEEKETA